MKRIFSFFLCLCLLFSLCACGTKGSKTVFKAGVLNSPVSFDPQAASNDAENLIAANCFEGLFRFDQNGEVDLAGAVGYSVSADGLTYTFELNKSACWHLTDANKAVTSSAGKKFNASVTAEDYVYGLKRAIQKKLPSYEKLLVIDGAAAFAKNENAAGGLKVKALTDDKLEIRLSKPCSDFVLTLAEPAAFPASEAFCSAAGEVYGTTSATVLCNGPYYLSAVSEKDKSIKLLKNPDYQGRATVLNAGVTLFPGSKAMLQKEFQRGNYDVLLSNETVEAKKAGMTAYTTAVWGLGANIQNNFMKNSYLRQALFLAADTSFLKMPSFASGKAESAVPGSLIVTTKKYSAFAHDKPSGSLYDSALAADYFARGLRQLKKSSVTVEVLVPEELKSQFALVTGGWSEVFGSAIKVNLDTYTYDSDFNGLQSSRFDMAMLPVSGKTQSAGSFLAAFYGESFHYTSKNYNKALTVAAAAPDEESKAASLAEAEALLEDDAVFEPIFTSGVYLYSGSGVKGIYAADGGKYLYFCVGEKDG